MPSPYVQLLRTPHAWPFSFAGFFARLPLAMGGLALLLLVVDSTDSYFLAGAVDATYILVGAFAAPAVAILIDRYGMWLSPANLRFRCVATVSYSMGG